LTSPPRHDCSSTSRAHRFGVRAPIAIALRISLTTFLTLIGAVSSGTSSPTVRLEHPVDGSIVYGVVPILVTASDDAAVTAVQVQIDGVDLGPQATAAPYSVDWDTTTAADGGHVITAVARDAAGHASGSTISVLVVNAGAQVLIAGRVGVPQDAGGVAANIVVSTGSAIVAVPDVVGLTQSAATTSITGAGLVVGTVSTAASAAIPAGSVVGENPAAGAQVSSGSAVNLVVSTGVAVPAPVVIGSQIAGTFTDASGHSAQSHLVYAANSGVWWLFTLTSAADSQGGTNHIVKSYRSSGPDLATATWSAATDSPGAAASTSNGSMGSGRALGVAYVNNAPIDVVHAEVAMAFDGQAGTTGHIRARVTATSITWETWNYRLEGAATWTRPRAVALGLSTGKYIHSGGPTLQQEVDANARKSTNPDTGAAWTSGFGSVAVIDNRMIHERNAIAFEPLASDTTLEV